MLGASEKRSPEIEEADQKIKVLIVDIEGTTTSISFVKDTLFPYIRENLESYLKEHWDDAELTEDLVLLRNQAEKDKTAELEGFVPIPIDGDDGIRQAVLKNVLWQMDMDRKTHALKQIQGHVMKEGYLNGRLKGHVYDDVPPSLRSWKHSGREVYVYSSGSVAAQKLLFGYSEQGDLLELFSGYFDTEVGPKVEASSYSKIASNLNCKSSEIMFLTDVPKEAKAASEAGLNAVLVSRPGNAPLTNEDIEPFRVITSFHDIVFEASAKKKKLSVDEGCTSDTVLGSSENEKTQEMEVDIDSNVQEAGKVSVSDQKVEEARVGAKTVDEDPQVQENKNHEVPLKTENKKKESLEGNEVGHSPQKLPSPNSNVDAKTNTDIPCKNDIESKDEKKTCEAGENEKNKNITDVAPSSSGEVIGEGNRVTGELKSANETELEVKTELNNTATVVSPDVQPNANIAKESVDSDTVTTKETAKEINGECNEREDLINDQSVPNEEVKGKKTDEAGIQVEGAQESEGLERKQIKNAENCHGKSKEEAVNIKSGEEITANAEKADTKTEEGSRVQVADKTAAAGTSDVEEGTKVNSVKTEEAVCKVIEEPACVETKQAASSETQELPTAKPEGTANANASGKKEERVDSKTEEPANVEIKGTASAKTEEHIDATTDKPVSAKTEVTAELVNEEKATASADTEESVHPKTEVVANTDSKELENAKTEVTTNIEIKESVNAKTEVTVKIDNEVCVNVETEVHVGKNEPASTKPEVTADSEMEVAVSTKTEENKSLDSKLKNTDETAHTKTEETGGTKIEAVTARNEASLKQDSAADPSVGKAEVEGSQSNSEVDGDVQMTSVEIAKEADCTKEGDIDPKSDAKESCLEEKMVVISEPEANIKTSEESSQNIKEDGKGSEVAVAEHEMVPTSENNKTTNEPKPVKCNTVEDTCEAMETDRDDEKMETEDVAHSEEEKSSKSEPPVEMCLGKVDSKSDVIIKEVSKENGTLNESEASEIGVKKVDSSDVPSAGSTLAQS